MLSYVTCYQPKIINLVYGHFHEKTFTHMSYHVHDFIEFKERRWCYLLFLKNLKKSKKSLKLYFKVNKKDLKLVFHFHISKCVFNSFYIKAYVFKRKCKNMKINSKIINLAYSFILMLSYVTCYQPKIINLSYGHFHEKTFTHMSYHLQDFIEFKERR